MTVLTRPIRIAVVDDQAAFRDAVQGLVEHTQTLEWAGSAVGQSDLAALAASDIDLLLMDVNLPGRDGIALTRDLIEMGSRAVVVLCSTYDVHDLPAAVHSCGARAYLRKEDLSADVLLEVFAHRPTLVEYLDS